MEGCTQERKTSQGSVLHRYITTLKRCPLGRRSSLKPVQPRGDVHFEEASTQEKFRA